ncbi:MAG: F0F1 ATP synthase subunit B [Corynebacterium matruchotii]|jgi:ATP synthase F0, B subunit|nr:F0F1 ATP synthase subunit B [Corynebacterium matruchotii]RKW22274.1 MAG: F0F1 ATP synthase subunit B [Corynebacterium sp.]EEG25674.1 ATP synthase F0, B subunit [Corynebacterium matruchotii ATCC 33806]KAB1926640.1 F0F1 ATP synthase subunit B [Corynebacterium matruchotii]QIP46142.1 F0F1 ATP synthase subunit B [Corynebacterium matruchotii]SPW34461.1 ATP synthase F0F1 subunit B [Corynebacterium matruchotii]
MTNMISYLAEGSSSGAINPLLPTTYDIGWSIVVLLVVGLLFWKLVLPSFLKTLAEREELIKSGIENAEKAQNEAKAVLEKYNKKLADARIEAAEIREAAQEKGKQIEAEMKAKATEESARIIENGEKHLAAQRELVVAELRREMGQNAISLAEALVGEQLSENVKRSGSIDRFLDDLDSISAKSAGK